MDEQRIKTLRAIQLAGRRLDRWFDPYFEKNHTGPEELLSLDFEIPHGALEELEGILEQTAVAIEAWGKLPSPS
jgi:hypothetical protein